jgi:hypothetical protein
MVQSQRRAPSTGQVVLIAQAPNPLGPSPARAATSPPDLGRTRNPSGPSAAPNLPPHPTDLSHRPFSLALLTGPSHWPFSLALLTGPSHWPFPLALPISLSHWPQPPAFPYLAFPYLAFPYLAFSHSSFPACLSLWPFALARYREAWACGGARWAASSYALCAPRKWRPEVLPMGARSL